MKDETIDKILDWILNHIIMVPFIIVIWLMLFHHFSGLPSALVTFGDNKPAVTKSTAPEPYVFRAVEPIK